MQSLLTRLLTGDQDVKEALITFSEVEETRSSSIIPYFQPIFEGVCQYQDLRAARLLSYENDVDDLAGLTALLACRNAGSAAFLISASSPAQMFQALSRYVGFAGPTKHDIALEDNLGFLLLQKV